MPKSVKKIEKDAFKGCKKLTLYVKKGSYAHKYAKKYHVKYKYWKSVFDFRRCMDCKKQQGKVYLLYEIIPEELPLHPNCRCSIQCLEAKAAGTATKLGLRGADWWLKTFRRLPRILHNRE